MNPNNFSPDLFGPPTMPDHGFQQSSNDYFMMRGNNSTSPMNFGTAPGSAGGAPQYNFGGSFVNSSPIPMYNYPGNSTSSSNRSSVYGATPGSYPHSMPFPQNNPPSQSNPPSTFPYKNAPLFIPAAMSTGQLMKESPPLFINYTHGSNPYAFRAFLPSDILAPKADHREPPSNNEGSPNDLNVEEEQQSIASVDDTDVHTDSTANDDSDSENANDEGDDDLLEDAPETFYDSYAAFLEEIEKYAPKTREENPSGEYTFESGRKVPHCILTEDEIKDGPKPGWQSMVLKGGICNIGPAIFRMKHIVNLYVANNQLTTLPQSISQMKDLEILDLANNVITTLPLSLADLPKLKELYLENNKLEDIPSEIGRLHNLEMIDLTGNPLNPDLSKVYGEGGKAGKEALMSYLVSRMISNVCVPVRPFVTFPAPVYELPNFTLLCYNILADNYATSQAHIHCPPWALHWKYRSNFILRELEHYSPDIFALQELQEEQFFTVFKIRFAKLGYASTFYPKSRAAMMAENERGVVDGCALFWKTKKFEFESEDILNYNEIASGFGHTRRDDPAVSEFLNRIMPRDNVAQIITLKPKIEALTSSPVNTSRVHQSITIANTHLFWDPLYSDVKIVQSMLLVRKLKDILSAKAGKLGIKPDELPLIIVGDFNSLPDSAVHDYLGLNRVLKHHPEFRGFSHHDIGFIAGKADEYCYHNLLNLASAFYPHYFPFTNYSHNFKGCIDHIFISKASIQTLDFLGPVDEDWIRRNNFRGFPNECVPSDHIPIMCRFALRNVEDKFAELSISHIVPSSVTPFVPAAVSTAAPAEMGGNGFNSGKVQNGQS